MNRQTRIGVSIFLAILFAYASPGAPPASAEAPNAMTYQGRLRESSLPVTGVRVVNVLICDDEFAGACFASGEQNVTVSNGL
ncbi:MAG: hypothetical protein CO113_05190, partial [Elusimicrobia bacterium CG_4_9_14_3_um_filter_62_55]